MKDILGLTKTHKAVIIGGGRIGQALANYKGFKAEGVEIKAVFDIETKHIKGLKEIEVLHIDNLEEYIAKNGIEIAIVSVQKEMAEQVSRRAINSGIKAIWNFAPIDLYFGEDVVCENINMSESLIRLIYKSKNV